MAFLDLPSNLIVSNVKVAHFMPQIYNESIAMISDTADRGLHRLEGSFDVTVANDVDKRNLEAFLLKIRGRLNPFYIQLGGRFTSNTVVSSLVDTTAGGTAGDNTISVASFTGSITAGDMFNIVNDDKIYMALDDHSGAGTINIYPAVRKDFVLGTDLKFNNTKVLVRLDNDRPEIDYTEGGFIHTKTFNFVEALL